MKVLFVAIVLIALQLVATQAANTPGYTIYFFSEPDCAIESYVDEREGQIGKCANYYYDNQLSADTPCSESITCLHAAEPTTFCNDVEAIEAKGVFTGEPGGFYIERGNEVCSANRDFEVVETPFRTCILAGNYQGCYIKIVPHEDVVSSENPASILMVPILLISLVAFLI